MPPPWMDLPVKNKPLRFVMQYHDRGKSRHTDFRMEVDGHLIGWTLDDPGNVSGRASLSNVAGMNDKKILAQPKARQPKIWLTLDRTIPPGAVGATKNLPARFTIIDKGTYEMGAQKANLFEVFLKGRHTDRFILRLIPSTKKFKGKQAQVWLLWKPKDQTPFVLSLRAKNESWVPTIGRSAMSTKWEALVPKELRWWERNWTGEMARNAIDEVRNMFLKRDILQLQLNKRDFVLQRLWWKGQKVIRDQPIEQWHLRFRGLPWFNMNANPIEQKSGISGIKVDTHDPRMMSFEGEIPPSSPLNHNKKLPATVEVIDSGKVDLIEDTEGFKSFRFDGRKLKGFWIARSTDGTQFTIEKGKMPGDTMSYSNKLSSDQVKQILELFKQGNMSLSEIAATVQCSRTSVFNITASMPENTAFSV